MTVLFAILLGGCVLDRTGQSASEAYRRDLVLQATRLKNIESQFDDLEARTGQMEELNRTRGQDEIMRMESLDQIREEVARLRGDVEVLQYEYSEVSSDNSSRNEDAAFRLAWLEERADQLEESLGLSAPPPPELPDDAATADAEDDSGTEGTEESEAPEVDKEAEEDAAIEAAASVSEPDSLIELAESHLAGGRERAAEAVLSRFLELHPEHERVAEARYRYAEAGYNDGRYAEAVLRFQEVVDNHKDSPWAPWAMLRQGECFDAQDQSDNANLFYEDLLSMWPRGSAAKEARRRLND